MKWIWKLRWNEYFVLARSLSYHPQWRTREHWRIRVQMENEVLEEGSKEVAVCGVQTSRRGDFAAEQAQQ